MAVDASWDFASDANAYFEASIILGTSTGGAFDRIRKSTSQGDAAGSMTNYLLSAIFSYTGAVGETADLSWYMESSLAGFSPYTPGLTATIDARNTGTIFYRTTGSLQASSSGSTFLTLDVFTSDAGHLLPGAGPSPVPLPAGGGLLLLGIACLAVGRRRRQRA